MECLELDFCNFYTLLNYLLSDHIKASSGIKVLNFTSFGCLPPY